MGTTRKKTAAVCAGIGLALLALMCVALRPASPPSAAPASLLQSDDSLDMLLIDIADGDAAAHYHVGVLGVYVLAVDEHSAAYAAGVRSGDRIISLNGVSVDSSAQFAGLREEMEQPMELVLSRGEDGELLTITLAGDVDRNA
ncbi:MAG: PDZ domain-containing protein [Eubacteriales bacterium]|nr:PDZ domain-containing protein [Eubacteriales bacterium]